MNISKRVSWQDREGSPSGEVRSPFPMFTGSERQLALKLCGWSFGNDGQSLEDYLHIGTDTAITCHVLAQSGSYQSFVQFSTLS